MLKILLADDHAIIRKGLRQILLEEYLSADIDDARDAEEVMKMMMANSYDVIICDLSMPGRSGLDVVEFVKQNYPRVPVLILSIHPEEQYAIRALRAGASGYLSKDTAPDELVKAVQRVLQGRKYISAFLAEKMASELENDNTKSPHELLSNREFHVCKLLAEGRSVTEIAEQICLSVTTVSTYRARVMLKMNMKTNAELTKYCLEQRLI